MNKPVLVEGNHQTVVSVPSDQDGILLVTISNTVYALAADGEILATFIDAVHLLGEVRLVGTEVIVNAVL